MAVDWYGEELMLHIKEATDVMLTTAAFAVVGQTQVNIENNKQVDTGFMKNTVYAVAPGGEKGGIRSPGQYKSKKEDRMVSRNAAPQRSPKQDGALVGVAAEYALYQEMRNSFLYRALEQVAGSQGGEIVAAGKAVMP